MVNADDIKQSCIIAKPLSPEDKSILLHTLPVIDWIAPALPVFTKIIRRNSCDKRRFSICSKQEFILIHPNVQRIQSNIKWYVAHYFYLIDICIVFKGLPLPVEFILDKHLKANFRLIDADIERSVFYPIFVFFLPFIPAFHAIVSFKSQEYRIGIYPFLLLKRLIFRIRAEILEGFLQIFPLICSHFFIIHPRLFSAKWSRLPV